MISSSEGQNFCQRAVLFFISLYRVLFAPFLGGRCRFYPSCSQYAEQAVLSRGAVRGTILSLKRLLRCHPFHSGGYDPVEL